MIRRTATLVAFAAFVAAGLPSTAAAGTATAVGTTLQFTAGPGEANDVTVSQSGDTFTIADSGAPITPTPSCPAVNPNQVTCTGPEVVSVFVNVANGNDEVQIDGSVNLPSVFSARIAIDGGDGNDVLTGAPNERNDMRGDPSFAAAPGDDIMTGGARDDSFSGDPGTDRASGGAGEDFFSTPAQDGPDVYNGGPDFDSLNIGGLRPINVSLDGQANDGERCPGAGCEGDNVGTDIENVFTGSGDDVVTGSPAQNQIFTSNGDDRVFAGGGADFVSTGNDEDRINGGAGSDQLAGELGEDQMLGGPGDDVLISFFTDDEPDLLAGGRGTDLADYSVASGPVRVDLDNRADDGVEGENDNVRSDVEDILGSEFADVLVGNGRANELMGGWGNDRIFGQAGPDGLLGERGNDLLVLGPGTDLGDGDSGADRFRSRDKSRDQLRCGSSIDRVTADRRDRMTADCDRVRRR